MQLYNFVRLVNKYSHSFVLSTKAEGEYDSNGDWVDGVPTQINVEGALLDMSESKIYNTNGVYTTKDKVLYMLNRIDGALLNSDVVFNGNIYSIEQMPQDTNADFTGVFAYILKWVSVFRGRQDD